MANATLCMGVLLASLAIFVSSMPIDPAATGKEFCLIRRAEAEKGPPWEQQNPSPPARSTSNFQFSASSHILLES
ncbi:hypothetical protein CPB85DRAFT_1281726 [Mucidula mucida]|nr:hypothetical protein CPB85DRAFT_1281726 [Mucidula mucida]